MNYVRMRIPLVFTLPLVAVIGAACGDPFALSPATVPNRIDTTEIFALSGTDIGLPSAYDIVNRSPAITELGELFDFVFDIQGGSQAVVIPNGALGLVRGPGIQLMANTSFDAITLAPTTGYNADSSVAVAKGSVFVARSRSSSQDCSLGSVARFGKFEVLEVDTSLRRVTFQVLVGANCGFRGLEPGIPTE